MNLPGLPAVGRRHASSPKTPTKSLPVSPTRWWQRSLDLCLRSRPSGFFHEVTEYPTRQQKHALAVQIAQLEGCEGYNVARVQAYFKDKRKLAHRRAARDGDAATLVSKHAAQAAAVAGEWLSVSSSNYTSCPAEVSCTGYPLAQSSHRCRRHLHASVPHCQMYRKSHIWFKSSRNAPRHLPLLRGPSSSFRHG